VSKIVSRRSTTCRRRRPARGTARR
jgi:hypothetical protein